MCAALQLGGNVKQHWLMSKHDVIHGSTVIAYHYGARGGPSHGGRYFDAQNLVKIGRVVPKIIMIADGQTRTHTHTHTDTLITILRSAIVDGVTIT